MHLSKKRKLPLPHFASCSNNFLDPILSLGNIRHDENFVKRQLVIDGSRIREAINVT